MFSAVSALSVIGSASRWPSVVVLAARIASVVVPEMVKAVVPELARAVMGS